MIYTSVASGDFNSSSTWSPAGVPGNGDSVVVAAGTTVTVSGESIAGDGSGAAIAIDPGATLTLEDDATLWVYGGVDNQGSISLGSAAVVRQFSSRLYISQIDGFWESSDSWNPAGVPSRNDLARIASGTTITVDADAAVGDGSDDALVIEADATLILADGVSLSVYGSIDNRGALVLGFGSGLSEISLSARDLCGVMAAVAAVASSVAAVGPGSYRLAAVSPAPSYAAEVTSC